jgi:CheY-like chemotaxis protein
MIRLEINDTGTGISEDKKEMLFKPFSQIDDSMLKKSSGTGLGLTISKKIAQLMGGDIGFQSTFEKGSTFWVTLAFTPQKKGDVSQEKLNLKGCRVLFIEPYENRRKVLREYLTILNIPMDESDSGKTGQTMLEQADSNHQPYDLCIVDPYLVIDDTTKFWQYLEKRKATISTQMIALLSPLDTKAVVLELFAGQITKPITYTGIYQIFFDLSQKAQSNHIELPEDSNNNVQEPSKKRILVVDDDPINQQIVENILKKEGYKVSTVNNGLKAIDFLKKHSCDLIFMDLLMPEKDGVETTKEIRNPFSDVYQPQLPIIAMSANAMHAHKKLCLEAGMNEFLSKPINFEKLTDVLNIWLFGKQDNINMLYTAVQQETSEKLFDVSLMKEYMKNDMSLVHKTIDQFKKNAPLVLEKLKEAVEIGDIFAIDIRAHTIKGNAKSIFSKPLIKIAEQIEMASKKCDLNRIEALIPYLEKQLNIIIQKISRPFK